LVIGFGNPLRTDDGIGWRAVEQLRGHYTDQAAIDFIACHQLYPELCETIAAASCVLFIDAVEIGIPGQVEIRSLEPRSLPSAFTHELDPASVLASTLDLYGEIPPARLITVCGQSFAVGTQLTPAVEGSLSHLHRLIEQLLPSSTGYVGEKTPSFHAND